MRYRQLDSNGDYTFGQGGANFHVDSSLAVAQSIKTRLKLTQGEWFLDVTEGTPYDAQILGAGKVATYSAAIQQIILATSGVTEITGYTSNYDPTTRKVSVSCTVSTVYGVTIGFSIFGSPQPLPGSLLDINFILNSSILG